MNTNCRWARLSGKRSAGRFSVALTRSETKLSSQEDLLRDAPNEIEDTGWICVCVYVCMYVCINCRRRKTCYVMHQMKLKTRVGCVCVCMCICMYKLSSQEDLLRDAPNEIEDTGRIYVCVCMHACMFVCMYV